MATLVSLSVLNINNSEIHWFVVKNLNQWADGVISTIALDEEDAFAIANEIESNPDCSCVTIEAVLNDGRRFMVYDHRETCAKVDAGTFMD